MTKKPITDLGVDEVESDRAKIKIIWKKIMENRSHLLIIKRRT